MLIFGGGGGGDISIFENSPRKWPNSHLQKLFLSLFGKWQNNIIIYYQNVLQLPVPLNTLHIIHLNAKSHNLLEEPNSRKYNLQSP